MGLNDLFNSISARIPLAVLGGMLYGFIVYEILLRCGLSLFVAGTGTVFVILFYLGPRFLILFSGIDSPYYWRQEGRSVRSDPFYRAAQWAGTFYHYHDIALFAFLILICIAFLITLMIDWTQGKQWGDSTRNLLNLIERPGGG